MAFHLSGEDDDRLTTSVGDSDQRVGRPARGTDRTGDNDA
jgi:hypothetical protein